MRGQTLGPVTQIGRWLWLKRRETKQAKPQTEKVPAAEKQVKIGLLLKSKSGVITR